MKIGPTDNAGRPTGPEDEQRRRNQSVADSNSRENESRKDTVEISQSARQKIDQARQVRESAHAGAVEDRRDSPEEIRTTDLNEAKVRQDRVEQARKRVESDYYNRPEVKEEVARRLTDDFAG